MTNQFLPCPMTVSRLEEFGGGIGGGRGGTVTDNRAKGDEEDEAGDRLRFLYLEKRRQCSG